MISKGCDFFVKDTHLHKNRGYILPETNSKSPLENKPGPKREGLIFQPHWFSGTMLVLGRVILRYPIDPCLFFSSDFWSGFFRSHGRYKTPWKTTTTIWCRNIFSWFFPTTYTPEYEQLVHLNIFPKGKWRFTSEANHPTSWGFSRSFFRQRCNFRRKSSKLKCRASNLWGDPSLGSLPGRRWIRGDRMGPPFTSHKKTIWNNSHNPILRGLISSPWWVSKSPKVPCGSPSKWPNFMAEKNGWWFFLVIYHTNESNPRNPITETENGFMEPKWPMRFVSVMKDTPDLISWEYDDWCLG